MKKTKDNAQHPTLNAERSTGTGEAYWVGGWGEYNGGMTLEEWIKANCGPMQYGEQDENGVDLSLIRANLRLTPEERLLLGDRMKRGALELLEYGRRHREERAAEVR